jgi:DnaJ-class molecular chaperone
MFEKITFQQAVKQSQGTNFYKRLGVDSRATQEQITSAHKKLAVVLYPDRNPDQQEAAQTAMKKVNEAATILKDPDKRAAYDQKQSSSQQSTTQHSSWQQSSNRGQDWS